MECLTSPNMSGNIGHHENNQGMDYFVQLLKNAKNDPLWMEDLNEDTKILSKGRCMHCKNWVGDKGANVVQIQHVMNGCKRWVLCTFGIPVPKCIRELWFNTADQNPL